MLKNMLLASLSATEASEYAEQVSLSATEAVICLHASESAHEASEYADQISTLAVKSVNILIEVWVHSDNYLNSLNTNFL